MTSNFGKVLGVIFFAVIGAGILFTGLEYLSEWHEREIKSALEVQRKQFEKQHAELAREVRELETALHKKTATIPEERETEVFGKTAVETELVDPCDRLEKRIASFFDYIDKKTPDDATESRELLFQTTADLAENPPKVVGETRDLITLLRNQAHFFRILKKERIDMVRHLLKTEADVLESAMADFYAYYLSEDRCVGNNDNPLMPESAMYDYAGFFLETISGKSYLMRRASSTRTLTQYYAVLVLDQAIENGLNKYGIDIRDHIALAEKDIRSQSGLVYQDRYLDRLTELKRKYK